MKILTQEIKEGLDQANRAQVRSVIRKIKQIGVQNIKSVCNFGDVIGIDVINCPFVSFIGVEKDGYAHS